MTYPRSHLVDPDGGVYHVCSRCVRRAFLCGYDQETKTEYEHRRAWLEARMLKLSDIFAVDLFGYAVMSNHYHMVVQIVPDRVNSWSDDTVAEKWLMLFPRRAGSQLAEQVKQAAKNEMLTNPERMAELRARLSSLSWLMRCLNEPLARLANQEDCCKGRFWEGRFKSQRLLDETAVLAAMVYVDLNPIRAGIATGVEDSHHTSIHRRKHTQKGAEPLGSISDSPEPLPVLCYLDEYEELLIWTAYAQQNKRPISAMAQRTLAQSNAPNSTIWLEHYLPKPNCWQRAIGSIQSLKDYAKDLNQCWIKTRSMHLQS
tara:strand:- start:20264 stop:21208 length:945 start_codon:yes stop_codon:yes gene_type:complete